MKVIDRLILSTFDIQRLFELQKTKATKAKLKAEFRDELGRWWYTFQDEAEFPLSRTASQQTALQYLASGLTGKQFENAMEALTVAIANNNPIDAGAIVHRLTELPKTILNLDAIINVVAANYIREDEEPMTFSKTIHDQKCNWIMGQVEAGGFFLKSPKWILLLRQLGITSEALTDNLTAWQLQKQQLQILLDLTRSRSLAKE
jgi:hypothetical protein